jgi:predicted alpha/beta hydrolase family esterase
MTRILIIPGLGNSGPEHWQTRWEALLPCAVRVQQHDWDQPHPLLWLAAIDSAARAADEGVVLVAHSLGCIAVAHWAARYPRSAERVGGALLVAPADVDDPAAAPVLRRFAPFPARPLPFPAVVVASENDPYASLQHARLMARQLDAGCVNVGALGHINAASGLGDWPQGLKLLKPLLEREIVSKPWQPPPQLRRAKRATLADAAVQVNC